MRSALRGVFSSLRPRSAGGAVRAEEHAPAFRSVRKRRAVERYSMTIEEVTGRPDYTAEHLRTGGLGSGTDKRAANEAGPFSDLNRASSLRKTETSALGLGASTARKRRVRETREEESLFESYINDIILGRNRDETEEDGNVKVADYERWAELHGALRNQRKLFGNEAVVKAWKEWKLYAIMKPPEVPGAGTVWRLLLSVGKENDPFLQMLCDHIQQYTKKYGKFGWRGVYEDVVIHFLTRDAKTAYRWHMKMKDHIPPHDWVQFFKNSHLALEMIRDEKRRTEARKMIHSIHRWVLSPCSHTPVLQMLLHRGQFEEALKWHRYCMKYGDIPKTSSEIDGLLDYIMRTKRTSEITYLMTAVAKAPIQIMPSSAIILVKERYHNVDGLKVLILTGEKARTAVHSPDFLATIFKIEAFPEDHILAFLRAWGSCRLPFEALGSLYLRYGDLDRFNLAVNEFLKHGFTVKNEDMRIIMEERRLQKYSLIESSLLNALEKNDAAGALVIASQAVERLHTTHPTFHGTTLDMLTRTVLNAPDTPYNQHIIERYGALGRPPPKCPADNVSTLIQLFTILQKGYHPISSLAWHAIFKRLGRTGRLTDLAQLSLHLLEVHKAHPRKVRNIFPAAFFRSILEWPFLIPDPKGPLLAPFMTPPLPAIPKPPRELRKLPRKKTKLSETDFTWGIRLAKTMRDAGVHVDARVLRRALRVRLRDIVTKKERKMGVVIDLEPRQVIDRCIKEWGGWFEHKGDIPKERRGNVAIHAHLLGETGVMKRRSTRPKGAGPKFLRMPERKTEEVKPGVIPELEII